MSILSAPQNELGAAFRPVKRSLSVVLAPHQRMRTPTALEPDKGVECWTTIRAWGDATPEYWIDGRQHRPLRRRHSGKGRAVPVRCP